MAHELFSNMLDFARDSFRHLTNASTETMMIVGGLFLLLMYFVLRR